MSWLLSHQSLNPKVYLDLMNISYAFKLKFCQFLEMIDLEASLDKMEQELREINGNADVF